MLVLGCVAITTKGKAGTLKSQHYKNSVFPSFDVRVVFVQWTPFPDNQATAIRKVAQATESVIFV